MSAMKRRLDMAESNLKLLEKVVSHQAALLFGAATGLASIRGMGYDDVTSKVDDILTHFDLTEYVQ